MLHWCKASSRCRSHDAACRDADGDGDDASADSEEAEDDEDEEEEVAAANDERLSRAALAMSADAAAIARVRFPVAARSHPLAWHAQTCTRVPCMPLHECRALIALYMATTARLQRRGRKQRRCALRAGSSTPGALRASSWPPWALCMARAWARHARAAWPLQRCDALQFPKARNTVHAVWAARHWVGLRPCLGCCRHACCRRGPAWACSLQKGQSGSPRSGAAEAKRSAQSDHVLATFPPS
jgi:hypothetical protein